MYYHGIVHQIHRLLATIEDPQRRLKWQHIQGEIAEELDAVKNIMVSLNTFRLGSQESLAANGPRSFSYEEPTRDGSHYCVKVNHFSYSSVSPVSQQTFHELKFSTLNRLLQSIAHCSMVSLLSLLTITCRHYT